MGSGWHEWPLVIFTVFGQCVVGAMVVMGIALIRENEAQARDRILRMMFFMWLVMGVGFIASVLHLGSPLRAFNSLNRIGDSALSNEIASGSLFFAVGGLGWLLAVLNKLPAALRTLWLVVTMVLGIVFVWAMTRVYQIDTVPTWHNGYTTLSFFLTVALGGPLFAALLLQLAKVTVNSRAAGFSALALLATVAVVVLQSNELAAIHSSVQQASGLLPDYGSLQVWRIILLAAGLGCWLCPLLRRQSPKAWGLAAGLVLVLAGELMGRALFYGLHMTTGVAIAG
jgi:Tat-targeted selenate reductase subunit YnfH